MTPDSVQDSGNGAWYSLSSEQTFNTLSTSPNGLSPETANERLSSYGPNEAIREKPKGLLYYLAKQINQPLIYALLLAAAVTTYLQEWVDTAVIIVVVAVNAIIGLLQESKAGRDIEELMRYSVSQARVRRKGQPRTILTLLSNTW